MCVDDWPAVAELQRPDRFFAVSDAEVLPQVANPETLAQVILELGAAAALHRGKGDVSARRGSMISQ